MSTMLSRRLPSRRSFLGALALGLLAAAGGCDTTGAFLADEDTPRYTEPAARVVAWWEPTVRYTPDPANNGAPLPGIAGRAGAGAVAAAAAAAGGRPAPRGAHAGVLRPAHDAGAVPAVPAAASAAAGPAAPATGDAAGDSGGRAARTAAHVE